MDIDNRSSELECVAYYPMCYLHFWRIYCLAYLRVYSAMSSCDQCYVLNVQSIGQVAVDYN